MLYLSRWSSIRYYSTSVDFWNLHLRSFRFVPFGSQQTWIWQEHSTKDINIPWCCFFPSSSSSCYLIRCLNRRLSPKSRLDGEQPASFLFAFWSSYLRIITNTQMMTMQPLRDKSPSCPRTSILQHPSSPNRILETTCTFNRSCLEYRLTLRPKQRRRDRQERAEEMPSKRRLCMLGTATKHTPWEQMNCGRCPTKQTTLLED